MNPYVVVNVVLVLAVIFLAGLLGYESGKHEQCLKGKALPQEVCLQISCKPIRI